MTATIARLADVDLSGTGPIGWTFTAGGRPHQRVFEVSERAAAELAEKRGDFRTLEIRSPGREPLIVEKLLIVDIRAGKTPFTRGVLVVDRRWLWRRKVIVRDFNMRRKTGDVHLAGEGRIENQKPLPDIAYAPATLDNGKPFDGRAVLKNVLDELEGGSASVDIPRFVRAIAIEDLFINDPGDVAVERILGYMAGLSLWIDRAGSIRIFDTRSRREGAVIANAGPPLQGYGYHARSLREFSRPVRVNVLFERESEVRFDYIEGENPWTTDRNETREPRSLENVIPVPDAYLSYQGRTLGRGSYMAFDDFLSAISGTESRTAAAGLGPLSHAIIRKFRLGMSHMLFSSLYGVKTSGAPDSEWLARLRAVMLSWRLMFRPLPKWRDKMRSMKAVRVGVTDQATGTRAPAQAFMDYISKPSEGARYDQLNRNADVGHQIAGWATRLENGIAAPVNISVIDEQAGVILVNLVRDPWGDAEQLAPGNVDHLPTRRVNGDGAAVGNALLLWAACPLKSTYKIAIVLSCVQATPNNAGRYHKVTITPDNAAGTLGTPLGTCKGPEATVYVPAALCMARFMWSDDFASQIEESFFTGAPMPETLLHNAEQVKLVAEAFAAREYATYLDREEGAFSVALNPSVELDGSITAVDHSVPLTGIPITTIVVAPELEPLDPMGFVPPYVQQQLKHMVQT